MPNPWGSIPPSSEAAGRSASPPAPTSESSVYSGTALSGTDQGSAQRMLHVRNPNPGAPMPMPMPMGDVKDRTVFLSADRGLQVYGNGAASSASAPAGHDPQAGPSAFAQGGASASASGPEASSSSAPFQHQDAGALTPPQRPRPTKAAEASEDAAPHIDAPPAYEE